MGLLSAIPKPLQESEIVVQEVLAMLRAAGLSSAQTYLETPMQFLFGCDLFSF